MLAANFFDLRAIRGDEQLFDRLQQHVLEKARDNRIFLAYMAANAVKKTPPLGFFRNLVVISGGDHDNTLDLKHRGLLPISDLARVYALSGGSKELNTIHRLRIAREAGIVSREGGLNLEDAFELISALRARHQADQIKRGESPDNYVSPEELSPLERNHLKDAFGVISTIQKALSQRYQTERFY